MGKKVTREKAIVMTCDSCGKVSDYKDAVPGNWYVVEVVEDIGLLVLEQPRPEGHLEADYLMPRKTVTYCSTDCARSGCTAMIETLLVTTKPPANRPAVGKKFQPITAF